MKVNSQTGDVTLVRASDGKRISVPNGTDVTFLDDVGSHRLKNQHAGRRDEPVQYQGEVYFVGRDFLDYPGASAA